MLSHCNRLQTAAIKALCLFFGTLLLLQLAGQAKEVEVNSANSHHLDRAMFAAGCFWKVQYLFSKVPGVVSARAGYSGGSVHNPSYEQVCSHKTGHAEVVLVEFDPTRVSYRTLLETFWAHHDPTTSNRQGPDIGTQYRSVVFYTSPAQKEEAIKASVEKRVGN